MFVKQVKSNLKRGVDVTLGQHTVLVGHNGAGKSSVIQALQLAADGAVRDAEGRDELRTLAAIARFFPADAKDVYATVTLSDDTTHMHWEAKRTKTGLKVGETRRPALVVFPVQKVQDLLASDEKKVRAWLSQNVLGRLTKEVVLGVLSPEEGKQVGRLITQKALELDWNVISAAAKSEATALRRDATVKEKTLDQLSEGAPTPLSEQERDAIKQQLGDLNDQIAAGRDKTQANKDKLEAEVNGLALRYDTLEMEVAQSDTSGGLSPAGVGQLRQMAALIDTHVRTFGSKLCEVCGSDAADGRIVARRGEIAGLLDVHKRATMVLARQDEMAQILEKLQELVPRKEAFTVVDTKALEQQRDAAFSKLAAAQNADQTWATIRAVKAEVGVLRAQANSLVAAAETLARVGQERLQSRISAFEDAVSQFLPQGSNLGVDIDAGRLGFHRGGQIHTALSGGEWSSLLLALAAWETCNNKPPAGAVVVLTPEDRAWDPDTLSAVMDALYSLGDDAYQVILMSTVAPSSYDPDEWTVVPINAR